MGKRNVKRTVRKWVIVNTHPRAISVKHPSITKQMAIDRATEVAQVPWKVLRKLRWRCVRATISYEVEQERDDG